MSKPEILVVVFLFTVGIGSGADQDQPPRTLQLSAAHAKCREHVLPNLSEQSYRKIPWRASVLHGIVDAQKNDMPLMIVLMNGHPLGCT